MSILSSTCARLRQAEILSGVALSKEMRKRILAVTQQLSRAPCLAVVLVGDRADSTRYVNHKKRAAAECGIELRVVQLPSTVRQNELHKTLVAVNGDVTVDGVILQLPLPPHLRARPALFHIHPGKDVDGLHPLNAGNLFLQDQSPLFSVLTQASNTRNSNQSSNVSTDSPTDTMTAEDRLAYGLTEEVMLLPTHSGGYNALRRRTHESKFFVPCTALAIRSLLFSYLSRSDSFGHLMNTVQEEGQLTQSSAATPVDACRTGVISSCSSHQQTKVLKCTPQRDLHAVIVNKSMVVGVPTAALLQRAGGFVVTLCSRSNSLEAVRCLTKQADILITAYGQANVFDASCVKEGAVIIDAAINELPQAPACSVEEDREYPNGGSSGSIATKSHKSVKRTLCGDVDIASVSYMAAAVTQTPGGVGPLTVSHLMMNVLKAYRLRHANHLYYNNIYTEFLKMYGTYDKWRDYAPSTALVVRAPSTVMPADSAGSAATQVALADRDSQVNFLTGADDGVDDEDADNESYKV